jgi:hypothetical protein
VTNQIAPFGLQDLGQRDGSAPTMGLYRAFISSSDPTPIFTGDLVQDLIGAPASGAFGPYITQASSGLTGNGAFKGVFRGCEFLNLAVGRVVWSPFWPGASVGGPSSQADPIAYYNANPDFYFIAQATSAAIIGSSNIGQNMSVTATSSLGTTLSGQSAIALASSVAPSSDPTRPVRLIDFYSNYAPGLFPGQPVTAAVAAAQLGFVNGTDNTTPGQIMVVALNNIEANTTTGSSI